MHINVVDSFRQLRQRKLVGFLLQGCATTEKDVSIAVAGDLLLVIHRRGDRVQRTPQRWLGRRDFPFLQVSVGEDLSHISNLTSRLSPNSVYRLTSRTSQRLRGSKAFACVGSGSARNRI